MRTPRQVDRNSFKQKIILNIVGIVALLFVVQWASRELDGFSPADDVSCQTDDDCISASMSCRGLSESFGLCQHHYGAFCAAGTCTLSMNSDASATRKWLDSCEEYERHSFTGTYIESCYAQAAWHGADTVADGATPSRRERAASLCSELTTIHAEGCVAQLPSKAPKAN